MLIVQGIIISEEILKEAFVCDLSQCKGACCWEGDFGAPLERNEIQTIEEIFDKVKQYLPKENLDIIEQKDKTTYFPEPKFVGTSLFDDGRCVYMTKNEFGVAKCAFEQAYEDGVTDFKKPISCHLYPIRAKRTAHTGFESLEYNRWSICSAACTNGEKLKVPIYQFLKQALVRKYGADFYEELAAAADHLS